MTDVGIQEIPSGGFTTGYQTLRSLGTFWWRWFTESTALEQLYDAQGVLHFQSYINMLETVANLAGEQIPVFHEEYWYFLTLRESDMNSSSTNPLEYGDGTVYEAGATHVYGGRGDATNFAFPMPAGINDIPSLHNRIIGPSLSLVNGQDYTLDVEDGVITFVTNPFEEANIPIRTILNVDGTTSDREIGLWALSSKWDWEQIWYRLGYVLGIKLESSAFYRDFVNAVWTTLVQQPHVKYVQAALSAATGIPFALDVETVTDVGTDGVHNIISTNKNVYAVKNTSTVLVSVGDDLEVGDNLVNSLQLVEPTDSSTWSNIAQMVLNNSLLHTHTGPVVIENVELPVTYAGLDTQGKAIVEFTVSGAPDDVTAFWNNVHEKGAFYDRTLAEALDSRANPVAQPLEAHITAELNPLNFMVFNFIRNNTYLLFIRPTDFANGSPGLGSLRYLYRYLPPHTAMMIFVELSQGIEYYEVQATETTSFQKAVTPMVDLIGGAWAADKRLVIRSIPERCR